MKYDFKELLIFSQVAKLKSFAKAAKVLNLSNPVISTRISNLEQEVGVALLVRNTRNVNLTNEGRLFLEHCHKILGQVENLDNFLQNCIGISGKLRIVLPAYFSRYHIVPYLDEFLTKYPDLTLDISLTENPVNIIEEGFDLQIRIQIPEEEDLEVSKLSTNTKILCAAPSYLEEYGEPKTPSDLLNHNCLIFGENDVWRFQNKITREVVNLRDMKGNMRCDNGEIIKDLVLQGSGITLKSAYDSHDEIASGKIVVLLQDYEILHNTQFYAVYPNSKSIPPKTKAFIDFFKEKLVD